MDTPTNPHSQSDLAHALYRLKLECEQSGISDRPGFDAWVSLANETLGGWRPELGSFRPATHAGTGISPEARQIISEVVDLFPPSDPDVGFTPFEDWHLRLWKALAAAPVSSSGDGDGGELERLSRAATPGPWAYRPEHLDDWGYIRSTVSDTQGLKGKVVATTRGDEHATHAAHRAAGTDPYEANGRYIAALANLHRSGKLILASGSGEEKGGASPSGSGHSRAEPSGLGASPECPSRGWQPIATAPKDGRTIIAFGGRFDVPTPTQADGDWWNSSVARMMASRPTHWMPMPAPPDASCDEHPQGEDAVAAEGEACQRGPEGETPEPSPQSSPTLKTGAMTVEEARWIATSFDDPARWANFYRTMEQLSKGDRDKAVWSSHANRIETALRTLQDRGEVR